MTTGQRRQERGDDLELEVLLVSVAVSAPLEDADLVVQPLDQAEAHLVLRPAVGGDSVPVSVDHLHGLLLGRAPLPLEALLPAVELQGRRNREGCSSPGSRKRRRLRAIGSRNSTIGGERQPDATLTSWRPWKNARLSWWL